MYKVFGYTRFSYNFKIKSNTQNVKCRCVNEGLRHADENDKFKLCVFNCTFFILVF